MSRRVNNFVNFALDRLKYSHRDAELDEAKQYLESWLGDITNLTSVDETAAQRLSVSINGPVYKIQVLDDSLTFTFSRKNIEVSYLSNDGENNSEFDTLVYHRGNLVSEKFEIIFSDILFEKYLDWLRRTLRTFVEDL